MTSASLSASSRVARWPDAADLERARGDVGRFLAPTPLILSGSFWLKLEMLQPTGSFKVRGAIAALASAEPGSRIIAASAGNHALGIAFASETLNIPATVVIAETASPAKRAFLEARAVTLIRHGRSVIEAEAYAIGLAAESNESTIYVSPYNDPMVIAGQATVLDEIIAAVPRMPLRIVVPLGGGGLLAGIELRATELRTIGWDIEVVGVESSESLAVSAAVTAGRTCEVPIGDTIADGLAGNIEPGSITVDILRQHKTRLIDIAESDIRDTVRWLIRSHGLVAEGAGAAAVAAIRVNTSLTDHRQTIALVTGKNITPHLLLDLLNEQPASS